MPTYCYFCEKCEINFEHFSYMCESNLIPECPECKKSKKVRRDFCSENVTVCNGIKTIGSIADKNAATFSEDKKESLRDKTRAHE